MDKDQFLEIYTEIDRELIDSYMKAMKEQDMHRIDVYSEIILYKLGYPDTFEVHVLSQNIEALLDEYGIDYRWR